MFHLSVKRSRRPIHPSMCCTHTLHVRVQCIKLHYLLYCVLYNNAAVKESRLCSRKKPWWPTGSNARKRHLSISHGRFGVNKVRNTVQKIDERTTKNRTACIQPRLHVVETNCRSEEKREDHNIYRPNLQQHDAFPWQAHYLILTWALAWTL